MAKTTKTIKITRRSIVGFGYTSACVQTERGLEVAPTTKPYHTGTIAQVIKAIEADRELKSYRSGGTYYSSAWFVKVGGEWRKVIKDQYYSPDCLLNTELDIEHWRWSGRRVEKFSHDEIEIEVEA